MIAALNGAKFSKLCARILPNPTRTRGNRTRIPPIPRRNPAAHDRAAGERELLHGASGAPGHSGHAAPPQLASLRRRRRRRTQTLLLLLLLHQRQSHLPFQQNPSRTRRQVLRLRRRRRDLAGNKLSTVEFKREFGKGEDRTSRDRFKPWLIKQDSDSEVGEEKGTREEGKNKSPVMAFW